MGRIQGLFETGLLMASGLIKGCAGELHSITIAFYDVNAGARCYLRDGLTAAADPEVIFTFPGVTGTKVSGVITKEWPQGKVFDTGIYWDEGPEGGPGEEHLFTEMTVK